MTETILTNARIVCPDREVNGSLVIEDGMIAEILPRNVPTGVAGGIDLQGAILIPGIIDIHTDYLERELSPRPSARIPLELALHVMDLRALSCGLTTVSTAARISQEREGREGSWQGDGLSLARRLEELAPELRARHRIHIRWSTNFEPVEEILDQLLELNNIANLVFNDDTPGQRQFRDVEALIRQRVNRQNVSIEEARRHMEERMERAGKVNNRMAVKDRLAGRIPIGSHDDTTVEHVLEAFDCGATLSEMPCSIEAARKAKELGMMVCMGAPNYYRGGSHCGNLACHDAMAEDLVDIICSDYHFPSMLACAVRMVEEGMTLPAAIKLFTLNPARHLGMSGTLGSIESGKQADLVAFHPHKGYGDVTRVWVGGSERYSSLKDRPERARAESQVSAVLEEDAVAADR
jgi:alpha-D-ribose 1-methylphosphonate 5-triphosphate diphosphatase